MTDDCLAVNAAAIDASPSFTVGNSRASCSLGRSDLLIPLSRRSLLPVPPLLLLRPLACVEPPDISATPIWACFRAPTSFVPSPTISVV
eukprot:scaffold4121_cov381-Prasinococcus_capsulatus_cf.AAC.6